MPITRRRALHLGAGLAGGLAALRAAAARAAPDSLEAARKAGSVRIGCEATYPPFSFRRGQAIVGYDVDVAALLFKAAGVTPEFVDTEWAGVIPALYAERFDLVMSSLSYTKERMARVAYTIPYAEATQALLVRAADAGSLRTIDDMSGKVLAVKLGSPGAILQARLDAGVAAARGKGFAAVKTYDDHPAAYLALGQGTVDGVLNTVSTLGTVMQSAPGRFAIVRGFAQQNWAGIAARQDEGAMVAFLDQRLLACERDGSLAALQRTWFGLVFDLPPSLPVLYGAPVGIDLPLLGMALPLLARGALTTLWLSGAAAVLGTAGGLACGLVALSGWRVGRMLVTAYVDVVRGTPLLIQIFLIFFVLPGIGLRLSETAAGIAALALNAAGYIAEIVRGTVGGIERGQAEAGRSIGLTEPRILVWVLLPQAIRPMLPALTNELITLVKNSSLLSVISVYELTRSGQAIVATYFDPLEIYGMLALFYYAIITVLARVSRRLERSLPSW